MNYTSPTKFSKQNISPTEIIQVSKSTLTKGKYRKNNVWLWSEIFKRLLPVSKCELGMN